MLKTLLRRARTRAKAPQTRSAAVFVVAALAMAILGPLTAMAVGASSPSKGTTTVETVCKPVTVTVTTPLTTTTPAPASTVTWTPPAPTFEQSEVGSPVSVQLSATDSSSGSSGIAYGATGLPAGLTINPGTGLISGTVASDAQTSTVTVIAVAPDGSATNASFQWTVAGGTGSGGSTPTSPVSFTTSPFPSTESVGTGANVSVQLAAAENGSSTGIVYGAQGLPAGLAISASTGLISGTVASTAISGNATVFAVAPDGNAAVATISWTVKQSVTTTHTTTTTCTKTTVTTPPPPAYVPPVNTAPAPAMISVPKKNPFADHAMWIWMVSATDRGSTAAIIAQAKADHIGTLIIKSGDGTTPWSQFNPTLVKAIHAAGMKVCAWQYVYGNNPAAEAQVGDDGVKDGADCLVIDAEVQYQGKYVAAQTYIKDLRKKIGANFPVALAGLPYIGYHTNFPYSIFLGPNGAQYNMPQMYWIDIGTTVPYVYETTYTYNEIYQRPIYPLGQLYADSYGSPNASSIGQFNTIARDYKASGDSWWDFQSATAAWLSETNGKAAAPAHFAPATNAVTLANGSLGDPVIWAQERLDGAGAKIAVDGDFGPQTVTAVRSFQASHRLPVTGQINGRTWDALLKYRAVSVTWSTRKKELYATVARAPGKHPKLVARVSLRRR